jgi:hypothetical protein
MSELRLRTKKLAMLFATIVFALLGVVGVFSLAKSSQARAAFNAPAASPSLPEFIITVNATGTLSVIDTRTDIVYGPFLAGALGSKGGGLFDVAITPDGHTALVSNFGDSKVFFVDFSNPLEPSVVATITLPMFAEDIDITKDGRFALVTDGGFSPYVATIDVIQRSLVYTANFSTDGVYSYAVAIGAYNTVVTADYFFGRVNALLLDATGQLTVTGEYTYTQNLDGSILSQTNVVAAQQSAAVRPILPAGTSYPDTAKANRSVDAPLAGYHTPRPVNVAIAPDAQTVLVCDVANYSNEDGYSGTITKTLYSVGVYQITGPGELSLTGVITNLSRATQSIAFSPSGDKAYLSGNAGPVDPSTHSYPYAQFSVLEILGPGNVRLEANGVVDYPRQQGSQLFGVDTIAIANGKAYLGHPTLSGITPYLRIINLSDYSVKRLDVPMSVGVVARVIKQIYLPLIIR